MVREFWSRMRFLFAGKRRRDVDDEIAFHMERQVEANVAAGMSVKEARRQAGIAFGGRERAREQCRGERPAWTLELLLRDVRFAMRGLLRNPGLTVVAVLTLALAIGANTTIFSLLSQALLRALPVHDPQQLVVLSYAGSHEGHTHSDGGNTPGHRHEFSYPMYRDLRDRNAVLSGLIASAASEVGVTWNDRAEAVTAEMVTGNYFNVLGVRPALGRLLAASDETAEGANAVAVLSFEYWRTHLGEAPVEGRTLLMNGSPFTIVGVAAPGFRSMVWGRTPDVYVPMTMQKTVLPEWKFIADHNSYWIEVVGRLKAGVSAEQAAAAMNPLFHALREQEFATLHDQTPTARKEYVDGSHLNLEAGARGFSPLREDVRTPLLIMMAMVLLVIAMAIVNVASLLLVRAANRVREFSVRFALGATGAQILRQLLCEGLLLGVAGAALGLAMAPEALRLLIRWMQGGTGDASAFTPSLDWRVFAFTVVAMLVGSVLFSLTPAVQFWNPRLADSLRQQAGGAGGGVGGSLRLRRTCVALQIGFSLLLMVGAGMFVRTIENLRDVNPGFATDHLLSFSISPQLAGYPHAAVAPVELRIIEAVSNLPGIRGVAATNDEELQDDQINGDVYVTGYEAKPNEEDFDAELPSVNAAYHETMGIPLMAGRLFNAQDTATSQKVAIVNESFAKHYFANPQAALGRHTGRPRRPATDALIVGVVADVKHVSVKDPALPTCYTLFQQQERADRLSFYVRTWQSPESAGNMVRAAVAKIDSKLIVADVNTLRGHIDENLLAERTIALLAIVFGGLAALLAGIGLYGILAYSTAQRTREIGIRMALGARRGSVVGLILRETLLLAGCAVGATIPLAVLGARAVRSQLFGVSIADPTVYGMGILGICLVAAVAGFLPARRAASVDPARALRSD